MQDKLRHLHEPLPEKIAEQKESTENWCMIPRRRFLHLAAGAAALPAASHIANAQGYPRRTVRIVVGFPPGQAIDISARLMAEWLQQRLGQTFIVENRPGAAANVAT
jgi:tripartite-type tricarboxylate transporter receptor subunit TctC